MPAVGDTLREARMRQQIDVSEVEARTKIRAKYVRAMENEEFDLLPGPTFVKSFLRTYADFLGLDGHLLVEEYRNRFEPVDEAEVQPLPPTPSRRRSGDRRAPPRPGMGAVLVGLAIVVLAFLLVLGLTSDEDDGADRAATGTSADDARADRARERRARARARRRARERRAAARGVQLKIAPQGPTYACIDTGPETETVFEGTISEPRTFRGRRLRLNLGRTAAEVTVNGRAVPLGEGANPVGFDFTPRRREPLEVGERPCA